MYKTKDKYYINNDLLIIDTLNDIPLRKIRDFCECDPIYGNLTDLNPLQIGYETCSAENKILPEILPYYILHFVHKGSGYLEDETGTHKITANQMFIIKPHITHSYYPDPEDPWEYSWICFNGKYTRIFNDVPSVQPVSFALFQRIKELTDSKTLASKFHTVSILFDIVSTLSIHKKSNPDYVRMIKYHIDHNYKDDISVNSIAKTLYISRQYISKIFSEKENMTIQEYIIQVRLENAVNFMRSGFNVTESANAVGYSDLYTFSRIFKKKYGVSPSVFIKKVSPVSENKTDDE